MPVKQLKEYDVVKITTLLRPQRHVDGTKDVLRQPKCGDIGTIVHMASSPQEGTIYSVECVSPEGLTIWLADFSRDEIAPFSP
jgi:hypothetical protein